MNLTIDLKRITQARIIIAFGLLSIGVLPKAQAISPPPDGCYPGFTTAEGCNALSHLTTGAGNTGLGWRSLFLNTTGSYNTGLGAGTLVLNNGDSNTAVGTVALLLNTTGTQNTAVGTDALVYNDTGNYNTAVGYIALQSNTGGESNCAFGWGALHSNTDAMNNTAVGVNALGANTDSFNTAVGYHALYNHSTGQSNTAVGRDALASNVDGSYNIAIGAAAGFLITGSDNICIGVDGEAGVNNRTWIDNIYDDVATTRVVYADADGHLGTLSSSRRYKEEIKPMDKASETLLALRPVTFRYKKEVDPGQARSFGLIAEEVAEVSPDLITRDKDGKPQTVRYDAVNAMLLNEFLKEHKAFVAEQHKVEELETAVANLVTTVKEQAAQMQKVRAQLETSNAAPRVAVSRR